MPVIEVNYSKYPFLITVGSTTSSLPAEYNTGEEGRREWDEVVKDAESTPGVSILRLLYPTGQNVRMKVTKVFLPEASSETSDDSLDSVLDRYYTLRVIKDDGTFSQA